MNYLTGLANPALFILLINCEKYEKYLTGKAAKTVYEGKGQEPYKGEVERVLSSLGTYKLKKISTVVHAPWCLGDLRHYTNHKQLFSKWK